MKSVLAFLLLCIPSVAGSADGQCYTFDSARGVCVETIGHADKGVNQKIMYITPRSCIEKVEVKLDDDAVCKTVDDAVSCRGIHTLVTYKKDCQEVHIFKAGDDAAGN